jgi:hypothetical protein
MELLNPVVSQNSAMELLNPVVSQNSAMELLNQVVSQNSFGSVSQRPFWPRDCSQEPRHIGHSRPKRCQ